MSNMVHEISNVSDGCAIESDHGAVAGTVRAELDKDGVCTCPFCNRSFKTMPASEDESKDRKCNRCGYHWMSRGNDPMKCPKCGSYAWNKPLLECRCNVCNYTWVSRKIEGPARCPNCKSNRWDEVPGATFRTVNEEEASEVKRKWVLSRYDEGEGCVGIASALGLPIFSVIRIIKESQKTDYLPRL